ncbi:MAG: hypothetical protein EBU26_01780 [Verrucomicrobia bacterium]|nr:hypothetical protein [Verrucomicrobiota bacterium]
MAFIAMESESPAMPPPLYFAVAQVLAYVYRLRSALDRGTAWPMAPTSVPVPQELDPGPDRG